MTARREIPIDIIKKYIALIEASPHLRVTELGKIIRDEHPNIFNPNWLPKSVHTGIQREAELHGIDWPYRAPGPPIPPANLRWSKQIPELRFPHTERVIVISDPHSSAHDSLYVDRAAMVIERLGIDTAVYCGDQLDNAYLGHGGIRSVRAAPFEENIDAFTAIANEFQRAGIRKAYAIQGNHDDKPLRASDGETTYPQWWNEHLAPGLDAPEIYEVTHRYYCVMEPEVNESWPWSSGHRAFPWVFMHAKEYSIIAGRTPKMHGDVRLANIINGHEHHLMTTKHPNGLTWIGAAGTGQHDDSAEYKENRPTKHPAWQQGFITLINNYPETWHIHEMSKEMFDWRTR